MAVRIPEGVNSYSSPTMVKILHVRCKSLPPQLREFPESSLIGGGIAKKANGRTGKAEVKDKEFFLQEKEVSYS